MRFRACAFITRHTPWIVSASGGIDRRASHHASTARLLVMITPERLCASGPRTILSLSASIWTNTVSSTGTDSGTYPLASNAASYRSGPSSAGALSSNTCFITILDDDDDVRVEGGVYRGYLAPGRKRRPIVQLGQASTPSSSHDVHVQCILSSPHLWSLPCSPRHHLHRSQPAKSGAVTLPLRSASSTLASTSVQVSPRSADAADISSHAAMRSPSPPLIMSLPQSYSST